MSGPTDNNTDLRIGNGFGLDGLNGSTRLTTTSEGKPCLAGTVAPVFYGQTPSRGGGVGKFERKRRVIDLKPPEIPPIGGIQNAGSTCFLASALQVIAAIPSLGELFDPAENTVRADLKDFQKSVKSVLDKVTSGVLVKAKEIQALRVKCYAAGVVGSTSHQEDAMEALSNLLSAVGFEWKAHAIWQDIPTHLDQYIDEVFANQESANDYSSLEEMVDGYERAINIEVSPLTVLVSEDLQKAVRPRVQMQAMIDAFWADELIDGPISTKYYNEDMGLWVQRRFPAMTRSKTPKLNSFPDVIGMHVKQIPGSRVLPTGVDTVYPAGTGRGPRYRLAAILERRPGHYVARVRLPNGQVFEANDSVVRKKMGFEGCPGFGYIYVKDDGRMNMAALDQIEDDKALGKAMKSSWRISFSSPVSGSQLFASINPEGPESLLIPLVGSSIPVSLIRAVQLGHAIAFGGDSQILRGVRQVERLSVSDVAVAQIQQAASRHLLRHMSDDPVVCKTCMEDLGNRKVAVIEYKWSDGWGSQLIQSRAMRNFDGEENGAIRILRNEDQVYLIVSNIASASDLNPDSE